MAVSRANLVVRLLALVCSCAAALPAQDDEYELQLQDAQRLLDKGSLTSAAAGFDELLAAFQEERPADQPKPQIVLAARLGLLEIELRRGHYDEVAAEVDKLRQGLGAHRQLLLLGQRAARSSGRYGAAIAMLQQLQAAMPAAATDREVLYELGCALDEDGQRQAARDAWTAATQGERPRDADQLAYLGACRWRLGGRQQFEAGSQDLIDALQQLPGHAFARTVYGILKFEAYGETAGYPSGEKDLKRVLDEHGDYEPALLALYRLRSANFQLDPGRTERLLDRVLQQNERSVEALLLRGAGILDDRRYGDAANVLDGALRINGNHKLLLAHRAAVALLQHDDAGYRQFRDRALHGDPGWPVVDRVIADHLVALYRFADSLPYYQAALAAAGDDVASLQGMAKALVYCGEGERAKELLQKAKALEPGFVDPWRNNALAVQDLLDAEYTTVEDGQFRVQLHRDDVDVLRGYLLPQCLEALEVLGRKYDYRPQQKVKLEVFHTWDDFSVRTIGFRGFTALGACFGNFITLVSPGDGDLRRQDFMWEATVWHEYTHVLTLGLSRHRVPRWLTEGFSVYEEKQRDPAWERGMDRELFDAFHNRDIPPIHLLNRLFRGPRILFGYYQGGLIVELLARDFGFRKATELLMAFGEDLDLEAAFQKALGMGSAEFDTRLLQYVEKEKLRGMRLVPHFDDAAVDRLRVRSNGEPDNLAVRLQLAWAFVQRDNPVDAGAQLAAVLRKDPDNAQAQLVRAEMLRRREALDEALDCWRRGFAAGADDFDSRIACGRVLLQRGDAGGAEQQFQRAKALWPNCTEQDNAPELLLAAIYRQQGRKEQALMELKSYCKRTARAFQPRWQLAGFERDAGDRKAELQYLVECNRIDPFYRQLHERMAAACEALGELERAATEYEVAAAVGVPLDRAYIGRGAEPPAADGPEDLGERGRLWLRAAELRHQLGQDAQAVALLDRILRVAKDSDAAATARELRPQWQGR